VELRDYWLTIRSRWKLVVACVLLGVAGAAVITWQTVPLYASNASIFVSTPSNNAADLSSGGTFATQRIASYVDLVSGRQLAERVSDDLGGSISPDTLQSEVTAEAVPETVNLDITAEDPDPVLARDITQAYAESLVDLIAQLETPEGGQDSPIKAEVTQDAEISDAPVSPNPVRNYGLGFLLGLLVGVGLAVLRELLDTTIASAEDVATVSPAPILGNVHADATAVRKAPSSALAEATPWAESFRVLRTNMQYVEVDHDHRVFVISSSLPSEGKSTTSVSLAVTLALAGEKVALVECDLRRPTMADRLELDNAVGTTSVLIGRVGASEAMQDYGDTGLHVLPCGPRPPNPSELLQSQAMGQLIGDLRAQYDVVILDAPPLLPVTDAALLAAQADGMLAVVRHGKTTRDQLQHALERVESVGAKCVGVVINLSPVKRGGRYGYGYGYGYAYDYSPVPTKSRKLSKAERAERDAQEKHDLDAGDDGPDEGPSAIGTHRS